MRSARFPVTFAALPPACKTALVFLSSLILAALSMLRAEPNILYGGEGWTKYFWLTTYDHGYVRRGLLGTLAAPFITPGDLEPFWGAAMAVTAVFAVVAVALLLLVIHRTLDRATFWLAAGFIFVTPLLPYNIVCISSVGSVIVGLYALAALALLQERIALFTVLFAAGMLIHEETGFVLLPAAAAAFLYGRGKIRLALPLALGVFAAASWAAIYFPASPELTSDYVKYGMLPADAAAVVGYLNLPIRQNFAAILSLMAGHPHTAIAGIAYPLFAVLPLLWLHCRRSGGSPIQAATTALLFVFPYAPAFLGVDTSRLAAFGTFANMLMLAAIAKFRPPAAFFARDLRISGVFFAAALLLYWAVPLLWIWPGAAFSLNQDYHRIIRNPLAAAILSLEEKVDMHLMPPPPPPPPQR